MGSRQAKTDASAHAQSNAPAAGVSPPTGSTTARVVAIDELPCVDNAYELEGHLFGDAPLSIILVDAPPGGGPALHCHPYPEVFIVHEGSAIYTVGDATLEVTAGQIVVAPANVPHTFVNSGDGPLRQTDIHANDRFVTEWLVEGGRVG